jgi:GTPase
MTSPALNSEKKCGVVALIGAPNAGKSSLTNALVGAKVAIVSSKVQTTRTRLLGIAMLDQSQLLLIDTPGIFEPRRRLDRAMVSAAWGGTSDAEVIVLVVDAKRGITPEVDRIMTGIENNIVPAILVLNKTDVCQKERLLELTAVLNARKNWTKIFMVSAVTGEGVEDLKAELALMVPTGPWHFPEDQLSDVTQRMMAAEITREKIYVQLEQELPYAAAVETESWEQKRDGSAAIHQVIYVERDSQKAIVVGAKGAQIKSLGAAARIDMEASFGHRVHLFLHVKVKSDWADSRDVYRGIGLDWTE